MVILLFSFSSNCFCFIISSLHTLVPFMQSLHTMWKLGINRADLFLFTCFFNCRSQWMDFDEIWYLSFTLKHWANSIFVHTGHLQPLLYVQLKFTFMQISEKQLMIFPEDLWWFRNRNIKYVQSVFCQFICHC